MELPQARRVQLDLFYEYQTNVALYLAWQAFLRTRQPKTLIFRGQNDGFFTPEGGGAYMRDLPNAELHVPYRSQLCPRAGEGTSAIGSRSSRQTLERLPQKIYPPLLLLVVASLPSAPIRWSEEGTWDGDISRWGDEEPD